MSAIDYLQTAPRPKHQRGVAAIEFALVALIFFILVFGIVELARVFYIVNTLQEVTRRAAVMAATTDFSNAGAMQDVREAAIFRQDEGFLFFAEPVSDKHVRIDYLSIPASGTPQAITGSLPADPRANREACMADPNGATCIRLVRVRICKPAAAGCEPVPYQSLVSLVPMAFSLPESTTIVAAETFGVAPRIPAGS